MALAFTQLLLHHTALHVSILVHVLVHIPRSTMVRKSRNATANRGLTHVTQAYVSLYRILDLRMEIMYLITFIN
jgi:hypothetical protein